MREAGRMSSEHERLDRLKALKDEGILTEAEYQTKRSVIINQLTAGTSSSGVKTARNWRSKLLFWGFGLIAGPALAAVAFGIFNTRDSDGVTGTLPNGKKITAGSEEEAFLKGFTEGCASNYERTECQCLGRVILVHYSTKEIAEALRSGAAQGTTALLTPHQAEANVCLEPGSNPIATQPDVVVGVRTVCKENCNLSPTEDCPGDFRNLPLCPKPKRVREVTVRTPSGGSYVVEAVGIEVAVGDEWPLK